MTYGSVMASFNVEQFGTERVQALTHGEINRRFEEFKPDDPPRRGPSSCGRPASRPSLPKLFIG